MSAGFNDGLKLYNIKQTAEALNVSKVTIYRLVEERQIPFYKIRGSVRFAEKDIADYLEKNRVEPV
jgi:excisionase family DNA binding protein